MNFFLLSRYFKKNAKYHCNRHCVKMILELCQLLYAAAHVGGAPLDDLKHKPYKLTHKWHPTSIWVRKSRHNWNYTMKFAVELCAEYTRRYGKVHSCEKHFVQLAEIGYYPPMETRPIKNVCGVIKGTKCTPFPLAMPEDCVVYKNGNADPVKSYRTYYMVKCKDWKKKGRPMKWGTKLSKNN